MFRFVLRIFSQSSHALGVIAISLTSSLIAAIAPSLNGMFVDFLISNQEIGRVIPFSLIVGALNLIGVALSYGQTMLLAEATTDVTYRILRNTVRFFEKKSLCKVEEFDPSYIAQRLFSDTNTTVGFVIRTLLTMPVGIIVVLAILIVFLGLNPVFCLLAVLLVLSYTFAFIRQKERLRSATAAKKEADGRFFESVHSQLDNILDIQLNSSYSQSIAHLDDAFKDYRYKTIRNARASCRASSVGGAASAIFQSFLLVLSGICIINGNMTIGQYLMASSYFSILLGYAKRATMCFQNWQDASASYERICKLSRVEELKHGNLTVDVIKHIAVRDLRYSPHLSKGDTASQTLFHGLNATFEQSTIYAVVGKNGSGKSTFLKMLTTLYVSNGAIAYNGCCSDAFDRDELLAKNISAVPQNINPSPLTVREYIKENLGRSFDCFLPGEDKRKLSGLAGRIGPLLDKRCTALSGGELRIVRIWVAVNRPYDVLIMDEPSTGLDSQAKQALCTFLADNSSGKITILMTHDQDLIGIAQKQIVLDSELC